MVADTANTAAKPAPPRRARRGLLAFAVLGLLAVLALLWVSRPNRAAALILDRAGAALGLEISAAGVSEYRLRGTPMLLVREVIVREPGAATPLLSAKRIQLSLPWSTLRSRGDQLTVERIELDAPLLDLPAMQHWLASRPPSPQTRIPTLTDGLRIVDGRIVNHDWRIENIQAELPALYPDRPVRARLRGRYLDAPMAIPFDLAVALSRPAPAAGLGANGRIAIEQSGWRLPATVALSGPLRIGDDELTIVPALLGAAASYESGDTRLPFALGLHGPLKFDEAVWSLEPVALALRARGDAGNPIPSLDATGALALGRRLVLQLDGQLAQWPQAWPALPTPLDDASAPLPFELRYVGRPDLSETIGLRLSRGQTQADSEFRVPAVLAWIDAGERGAPLPPLRAKLRTPKLEISGATLEAVEIELGDEDLP
ncbi:hypothetical protein [Lysobacter sp. cf310]|uniref:hypothetical protein n=1 Tax=Lysobacter sp. cf310 TaxID=1761790 RepID=UPI0008EED52F|nr:hypothetical protein [Lysobacter sp. cf310]SFK30147.1 hypothetical protein SAMN04487938_0232 [Lysobacter sp. cf310]